MRPSVTDRRLINALCGDLPESLTPYADLAREVGMNEEAVLSAIRSHRKRRWLRRFGATVRHRRLGLQTNALVVLNVPDSGVTQAGQLLARQRAVSHCYERVRRRGWPYNLYVMLHAASKEKALNLIRRLADSVKTGDHRVLWTLGEFKKSTLSYFGTAKGSDPPEER